MVFSYSHNSGNHHHDPLPPFCILFTRPFPDLLRGFQSHSHPRYGCNIVIDSNTTITDKEYSFIHRFVELGILISSQQPCLKLYHRRRPNTLKLAHPFLLPKFTVSPFTEVAIVSWNIVGKWEINTVRADFFIH